MSDTAVVTTTVAAEPGFEEIGRVHGAALHRLCVVALGHPGAAEAAAREVLAAASAAYAVDRPAPPRVPGWLYGVACRVLGELPPARRGRRAPGAVASGWGCDVDDALVRAAALPPRERLATGLRCAGGLEYSEIGDILGLPAATAREACARGLRRIRAAGRRRR